MRLSERAPSSREASWGGAGVAASSGPVGGLVKGRDTSPKARVLGNDNRAQRDDNVQRLDAGAALVDVGEHPEAVSVRAHDVPVGCGREVNLLARGGFLVAVRLKVEREPPFAELRGVRVRARHKASHVDCHLLVLVAYHGDPGIVLLGFASDLMLRVKRVVIAHNHKRVAQLRMDGPRHEPAGEAYPHYFRAELPAWQRQMVQFDRGRVQKRAAPSIGADKQHFPRDEGVHGQPGRLVALVVHTAAGKAGMGVNAGGDV
ncbi:DNA adenine methylase [Babesia caballi]|uniref:DNA adenine methylase n=1 Tax=Babesia caballi TaxID=5871 RepID=A0AAV4LSL3_BABCB|nr:DNA adenine methylase [Babesia caballi]